MASLIHTPMSVVRSAQRYGSYKTGRYTLGVTAAIFDNLETFWVETK